MKKLSRFLSAQKWLILCGIVTLALFVGFSYLVHLKLFAQIDFNTTVRLQDHISRRFDGLFSFFSDIGKFEVVTIFLTIILGVYLIRFRRWFLFITTFLSYGLMHFMEIYGKAFVNHLPPPHFLLRTHDVFSFPEFYVQATNSYPSGHAGRALFLTAFLGVMVGKSKSLSKTQKLLIYAVISIYDLVMLVSRIYLGEHWLSDVIGGSILGIAMGLFAAIFL